MASRSRPDRTVQSRLRKAPVEVAASGKPAVVARVFDTRIKRPNGEGGGTVGGVGCFAKVSFPARQQTCIPRSFMPDARMRCVNDIRL